MLRLRPSASGPSLFEILLIIVPLVILIGSLSSCTLQLTSKQQRIARDKGISDEEMIALVKKDNKQPCAERDYLDTIGQCMRKAHPTNIPMFYPCMKTAGRISVLATSREHAEQLCKCTGFQTRKPAYCRR